MIESKEHVVTLATFKFSEITVQIRNIDLSPRIKSCDELRKEIHQRLINSEFFTVDELNCIYKFPLKRFFKHLKLKNSIK